MPPEKIVSTDCADAQRIGIELEDKIRAWRLFVSPDDFYFPYPGSEALRPAQRTPVRGLTLAGDYTKQLYMATMEGAVLSGKIAADLVLNRTAFPGQTYLCTYTLPAQRRKIPRSHLLRFTARALHWMMSKPIFQCSRPLRNSYIFDMPRAAMSAQEDAFWKNEINSDSVRTFRSHLAPGRALTTDRHCEARRRSAG